MDLLRVIGRGAMGVVYEARQISLNHRVALKVLPPGLGLTDQAVRRFEREAHAAAKLHHTGIVPVYATGREDGCCHYYATELIEGQALSEVLNDLSGTGSNPLMEATVTRLGGEEEAGGPSSDGSAGRGSAAVPAARSDRRAARWAAMPSGAVDPEASGGGNRQAGSYVCHGPVTRQSVLPTEDWKRIDLGPEHYFKDRDRPPESWQYRSL